MSAYPTSSVVSTPPIIEACWRCGAPTPSDGNIQPVHCAACRRMGADMAIHEALSTLQALRNGTAPFDVLTPAERAEQLAQLLAVDDTVPVRIARLSSEQLIDLMGDESSDPADVAAAAREFVNRVDAAPDPVERQRIETEDETYRREQAMAEESAQADEREHWDRAALAQYRHPVGVSYLP